MVSGTETMPVSDGIVIVKHLREKLWSVGGSPRKRRENLMSMLHLFVNINSNDKRYILCCKSNIKL